MAASLCVFTLHLLFDDSQKETLLPGGTCWMNMILICTCSISVLINIICMGAFCCRAGS
ncbi:putative ubiquitin carboxyl-terminal hydrolase 50 [Clarias magur]|uniref:Putative ubiquitin carboxyl-terminal hydrolase 50 n=1 Tax=Clarias magur TaxID=1594786 RepID=A0A8J4XBB7_CLAMG|nr:putative ubiquitin carboxyl-terminal hydrolase 50 [Clarias magur]